MAYSLSRVAVIIAAKWTTCKLAQAVQGADARDKRGHDEASIASIGLVGVAWTPTP